MSETIRETFKLLGVPILKPFIQPNSEANWQFARHLIRIAASIGIAAAFVTIPAATRVLAQDARTPAEVKDTVDPNAVDALTR